MEKWKRYDSDTRFNLPGLNSFIPDDFSLRCEDDDSIAKADSTVDYTKTFPSVIRQNPSARLWHKMDRSYKVSTLPNVHFIHLEFHSINPGLWFLVIGTKNRYSDSFDIANCVRIATFDDASTNFPEDAQ
jgi:hypothetical protein